MSQQNPYNAHSERPQRPGATGTFVPQVRIVAILMMIQGAFETMFGIYLLVMGFVMPNVMDAQMQAQQNQMPADQQEVFNTFFVGYFFVAGGASLLIGILRLVGGIMGIQYRGRGLGLASHFAGLLMLVTCYCFPTSLALGVYGCIVYFNSDVVQAFRMRQSGRSTQEIFTHFGR